MIKFLGNRLLVAVPTLVLLAVVAFSLMYLVPGDPAAVIAGDDKSPERIAQIRESLGLDGSYLHRFGEWVGGLFQGNLGQSLYSGDSINTAIAQRFPVTLSLALVAVVITIAVSLPIGLIAGLRPGSLADRGLTLLAAVGVSVPNFWIGLMFVLFFALSLSWLPAVGYVPITEDPAQWLLHLILPGLTLALPAIAEVSRQLRASIVDVAPLDYVRTARAKGLPESRVVGKHLLKNALVPAVTVLGLQLAYMLGGAVIVEQVFGLGGIGSYAIDAINNRDFPVIQSVVLLSGVIVIMVNIVVDASYGYLNPRVRTGG